MKKLSAIILAGGYGSFGFGNTRISKVVARLNGRPMVRHIVETLQATDLFNRYYVVINNTYGQQVRSVLQGVEDVCFPCQTHRVGSAGAAGLALEQMRSDEQDCLITPADMPLWEEATYAALARAHCQSSAVLTVTTIPLLAGTCVERYGRVVYGPNGDFLGTVDDPHFVDHSKFITADRVNPSLYCASTHWLTQTIPRIPLYNKGDGFPPERLLQSAILLANKQGDKINEMWLQDHEQALGVNTKRELWEVRRVFAHRHLAHSIAA